MRRRWMTSTAHLADIMMPSYVKFAEGLERSVINWADPTGVMKDSPTRTYPLSDLSSALLIAAAYLTFVVVGSAVMRHLPPVKLYGVQFFYNILQMALCSYMCIEAGMQAYRNNYTFLPCQPFNATNPPMGPVLWFFYISKILDFLDTVFIIIGKKWNQLSFLHIYHHVTIFLVYWMNLNAGYDGDIFLTVILNGAIHTVMYTYYFLSMHTKDIWWKKYLTLMQIVQFLTMNAQAVYLMCVNCQTFSPTITKLYLGYILSLLVLFVQFYIQSYSGGKKSKGAAKDL